MNQTSIESLGFEAVFLIDGILAYQIYFHVVFLSLRAPWVAPY